MPWALCGMAAAPETFGLNHKSADARPSACTAASPENNACCARTCLGLAISLLKRACPQGGQANSHSGHTQYLKRTDPAKSEIAPAQQHLSPPLRPALNTRRHACEGCQIQQRKQSCCPHRISAEKCDVNAHKKPRRQNDAQRRLQGPTPSTQ